MYDTDYFPYADVTGPASATNNAIALFNGSTGKILKNSGITLPSSGLVGPSDTQTLTNKTIYFTGTMNWSSESPLSVRGNGLTDSTSSAFMSFHRPGVFAANFGIDETNTLKWAGWSLGTVVPWSVTQGGVMKVHAAVYFTNAQTVNATTAATTVNFSSGQKVHLYLFTNTTVTFVFPGIGNYQVILVQDATGNRTVTWSSTNVPQYLGSATAPAINLTANSTTMVSVYWSAGQAFIGISKVNAA